MVMAEYINLTKNPCMNPQGTNMGSSQSSMSPETQNTRCPEETELSEMDYLDTKFWNKEAWKNHEKENKDLLKLDGSGHQSGPQGGTWSAQGKNVMMQYIEEADGTTISRTTAANIQNRAWSIWIHLYNKGIAPLTWSKVSRPLHCQ
ncbi:hypothetical protein EDB83DRAFT_2309598 [Lactarius deliciosus]|nr:hypothetical protein EDB83DRAFT_2309598 [Lactarius deliciosus]